MKIETYSLQIHIHDDLSTGHPSIFMHHEYYCSGDNEQTTLENAYDVTKIVTS